MPQPATWATQAVAQIASSQYGGQSISLAHLVPFVQVSREKYQKEVAYEFEQSGIEADQDTINRVAEMRVRKEVKQGVQMIQYQVITLMTTNGQAPFITVFMYLDEVPEGADAGRPGDGDGGSIAAADPGHQE